jgi:hypothetical protein
VEARLAATLLRLADREGVRAKGGVELPFHLTRQSLADMSGTTVETAIRVVSRWLRDESVEDRGGRRTCRGMLSCLRSEPRRELTSRPESDSSPPSGARAVRPP